MTDKELKAAEKKGYNRGMVSATRQINIRLMEVVRQINNIQKLYEENSEEKK